MKKYSLLYCAFVACAMVLSSCNNEFENANNEKTMKMSFTATSGNEVTTRTTLDEGNGISVNWTASDAISVFDASGVNNPFTLADGAGTNIGHFDGTVTNGTMRWTALYPYSSDTTISGNVIFNVAMPAEQEATVNGFDPKSNLMTAYTTNDKLNFKQVVCYVQITTTIDCKKITFKANGEESLAGTAELTVATDGRATNRVTSNGASEVTLIPANGQTTIPAGTYHIGILPQTLTQGFTVEAFKAEAEAKLVKTYNKQTLAFGRDKIVNLGTTEGWSEEIAHDCYHYYEFGKGTKEYVDLGLPSGLEWATCNLGATEPWEYGDYYAWAATKPWIESYDLDLQNMKPSISQYCHWADEHRGYYYSNTPYNISGIDWAWSGKYWTKYTNNEESFSADGANPADLAKTVLDPEDDAAHVQWGADWRMPTLSEFQELKAHTYWVWTDNYKQSGIEGYIVYKVKSSSHKNLFVKRNATDEFGYSESGDMHIFLPATECIIDNHFSVYSAGSYWSSSLYISNDNYPRPCDARELYFEGTTIQPKQYIARRVGQTVRPVYDPKQKGNLEGHSRDNFNW